jgi:hypothetical protein
MNNPIIDEVRRIREEHARKFNYDLAAICADLREHQKTCGHPVVSLKGTASGGAAGMVAESAPKYGSENGK